VCHGVPELLIGPIGRCAQETMPIIMSKAGAAAALQHTITKHRVHVSGHDDGGTSRSSLRMSQTQQSVGRQSKSIVPATCWVEAANRAQTPGLQEAQNAEQRRDEWSQRLNRVIGIAIVLNTVMLGLETDLAPDSADAEDRILWIVSESLFILVFLVEIPLRMYLERWRWPWSPWNWIDVTVLTLAIVETWILAFLEAGGRLQVIALVRIVRLVRLVRVVRLIRMFRALYVTVMAFKEALSGLFYICIIMVGGVYVCAIFMTAAVGRSDLRYLELGNISGSERFGSVLRSMYSLFELMTLEGWQQVGRPLVAEQPFMAIFFFGFIMIFTFGLLNMVVAVVVEKTLLQARRLEQLDTDQMQKEVARELEQMRLAFIACDVNHDNMIDRDEFASALQETNLESPKGRLLVCLDRLGIPTDDALTLFDILDSDASGELSMQEFLNGCARVLGASDPLWDQLATHALVLGLKRQFQDFRKEVKETLSRATSPSVEAVSRCDDGAGSPCGNLSPQLVGCARFDLKSRSGASPEDQPTRRRKLEDEFVPKTEHQRVLQEQRVMQERLEKVERQLLICLEQRQC